MGKSSAIVGASSLFAIVGSSPSCAADRAAFSAAADARMASAAWASTSALLLALVVVLGSRDAGAPDSVCQVEDLALRNSAEREDTVQTRKSALAERLGQGKDQGLGVRESSSVRWLIVWNEQQRTCHRPILVVLVRSGRFPARCVVVVCDGDALGGIFPLALLELLVWFRVGCQVVLC